MIRYLLGLIVVAVSVYALIYFYPGQMTGEDAVTDGELAAPQPSPEPAQPVPTPPAAKDAELAAPQTSPEPAQPVPTPPAATSPAPGKEPSTSTMLAKPSPQNLSKMTTRVQEVLTRQGYYKGGVDGISGPQTGAAIIEYQKAQGLPQTGQMDTQTLTRLGISIP